MANDEKGPRKQRKDLGNLHKLLMRGLPDMVNAANALEIEQLAEFLGITSAALYGQFQRERINPKRVAALVHLSQSMDPRDGFTPLRGDDFVRFL